MKKSHSLLLAGLIATLLSSPLLAAEPESCKNVRMSDPGWTDITATNAVAGVLLDALGYEQTVQNLSVPISFQGLKSGQLDVFLGNWMPAQKPVLEGFLKENSVQILGANLDSAKFTLAVPSYAANAGVKTFADLAKYADKFDKKIYGIAAGSPANQNIKKILDRKDFGLDSSWSLVESSETGMLTQVERAVHDKKWIVFLAWEPHQMNTRYPLTYLAGGDAYFGPNYGSATVNTATRADYAAQCPNAGQLFKNLKFSVDLENRIIGDILAKKGSAKAAAADAIKQNPAVLGPWLQGVKTRAGGDSLPAVKKALGLS